MFNEKLIFQIQNREIKIPSFPQPSNYPKNTNLKIQSFKRYKELVLK